MSAFLFHGPMARSEAIKRAESLGRMIAPPVGDVGLKVDMSRAVVDLLQAIPVGDERGSLVIGPFDQATVEAADALLKAIEEHNAKYVVPVLWAEDIGSVVGTIRSRCHEVWCPEENSLRSPFYKVAEGICRAALERKTLLLMEQLKEIEGQEDDILRASVEVLISKEEWPLGVRVLLWNSLREAVVLHRGNMNFLAALSAYMV